MIDLLAALLLTGLVYLIFRRQCCSLNVICTVLVQLRLRISCTRAHPCLFALSVLLWCADRAVRAGFELDGFVRSRVFYLPETVREAGCMAFVFSIRFSSLTYLLS